MFDNDLEEKLFNKDSYPYDPAIAHKPVMYSDDLKTIMLYGLALRPTSKAEFYSDSCFKMSRSCQLFSQSQAVAMLLRACREHKNSWTAKEFFGHALKLSKEDSSNILQLPEVYEAINIMLSTKTDQHGGQNAS